MGGRIPDDFAYRQGGPGPVAFVAREMQAARIMVEMRHPQAFAARIGIRKAAGEKLASRRKSVEPQRMFGTLVTHTPTLRKDGRGLDGNCIDTGLKPCPFRTYRFGFINLASAL